jgi:hypothetical protein
LTALEQELSVLRTDWVAHPPESVGVGSVENLLERSEALIEAIRIAKLSAGSTISAG